MIRLFGSLAILAGLLFFLFGGSSRALDSYPKDLTFEVSLEPKCYVIADMKEQFFGVPFSCDDSQNKATLNIDHISKVVSGSCYSFKENEKLPTYDITQVSCPEEIIVDRPDDPFLHTLEDRLTKLNCKELDEWGEGCPAIDEYGNDITILVGFP